jgi:hypothetical protein
MVRNGQRGEFIRCLEDKLQQRYRCRGRRVASEQEASGNELRLRMSGLK